jgi:hypothetical protein
MVWGQACPHHPTITEVFVVSIPLKTKKGKLTPFAFRCGYREKNSTTGLVVWWQNCCYFVTGWLDPEDFIGGVHVYRTCPTLIEARRVARQPYTPALPKSC